MHLWKIGLDFVYAVAVALAVGLVVGYANVRIRSLLKDPVLSTAASFAVPFLAWVPAEELGASGVLAVVVAGLVTGHLSPGLLPARDRLAETVNWETVAFLLESGIFLLMGLQHPTGQTGLPSDPGRLRWSTGPFGRWADGITEMREDCAAFGGCTKWRWARWTATGHGIPMTSPACTGSCSAYGA